MPVKYEVSLNGMFVHAVATGTLDPEEIYQYVSDIDEDERIKPGFRELFDVSEIEKSNVIFGSFEKIRELILSSSKRTPGSKLGIVARKTSSFYNAELYERLMSDGAQNVIVFNDVYTAKIWLGAVDISLKSTV